MSTECDEFASDFASDLARHLRQTEPGLTACPDNSNKLLASRGDGQPISLDLRPVQAIPESVTASCWFEGVKTTQDLLTAYDLCRAECGFEQSMVPAMLHVHPYAEHFRQQIVERARLELSDDEACLIAQWVAQLDTYSAIKAVESLLNSRADRALLLIARQRHWTVYMDHLAIRCGSQKNGDARRITDYLCRHFAYVSPQTTGEGFYQFDDGWDAYPLYKMLENGLMLRLFIDESSQAFPDQIIQHWNHVYGYTAHHLALRVAHYSVGGLTAVPLDIVMAALVEQGVKTMMPTGGYTCGLLEQVFTEPTHTADVPASIKQDLSVYNRGLEQVIENGKLIELVSRREMPVPFAERYFSLYGITYDAANPLHSAPCYSYFLPAQAAHVIKTSINVA